MLLSPALGRILFHQPHGLTLERRHRSIEGGGEGGKKQYRSVISPLRAAKYDITCGWVRGRCREYAGAGRQDARENCASRRRDR